MKKIKILWTDDEIDLLKPHILFLKERGYAVFTASNGDDAIELINNEQFDLVFLDENMPGLSGLEVLDKIKANNPTLPIVMITKNEEENIMDAAIGSKISDYLIKPVKPKQILLTIKKNIETKSLISKKTTQDYQSQFSDLGIKIGYAKNFNDWCEIYKQLVYWELELEELADKGMAEVYNMQKTEANANFGKYIKASYLSWFDKNNTNAPLLSKDIFPKKIFSHLEKTEKLFLIIIDNLKYDQWRILYPAISEFFVVEEEDMYCSILPTTTQYARNALFAGLMPNQIKKLYPEKWIDDDDERGKNIFEKELFEYQCSRLRKNFKFSFEKVSNSKTGKKLIDGFANLMNNDLNIIVYNFIDMLSHANTEMEMIKELASTYSAYRSLTSSWFSHSHLHDLLENISKTNAKVIITTDHGSILVDNAIKVVGDRYTSVNLRYKVGKSLNYDKKQVFEITNPPDAGLPKSNVNSKYIFALNNDYLIFPKNYNYYVNYFKNTFQHGGISMEEMLVPFIKLVAK